MPTPDHEPGMIDVEAIIRPMWKDACGSPLLFPNEAAPIVAEAIARALEAAATEIGNSAGVNSFAYENMLRALAARYRAGGKP